MSEYSDWRDRELARTLDPLGLQIAERRTAGATYKTIAAELGRGVSSVSSRMRYHQEQLDIRDYLLREIELERALDAMYTEHGHADWKAKLDRDYHGCCRISTTLGALPCVHTLQSLADEIGDRLGLWGIGPETVWRQRLKHSNPR